MFVKLALVAVMLDYKALLPQDQSVPNGMAAIRHLLRKHRNEANACAALVNGKQKSWSRPEVIAQTGTLKFHIRKARNENPSLQLESGSCVDIMEGCIRRIFQNPQFKEQWRDETIDGYIVLNTDCQVDIEHNTWTRDQVEIQCKADWNYYPLGEPYTEINRTSTYSVKN